MTSAIAAAQTASAAKPDEARPRGSPSHLVYSPAREQVLLIAQDPASRQQGLWAWDGSAWISIAAAGPPERELGGATYDSTRQRIVLFGGMGRGNREDRRGDLWEWDGTRWQQSLAAGPGPRDHHVLAFDAKRNRTVLYGGVSTGEELSVDTWEWDGTAWHQAARGGGPGGRAHCAMVFDGIRKRTVLFGGLTDGYRVPPETWGWDGSEWRQICAAGPPPRTHFAMAFDRCAERIVLFGGLDAGRPAKPLGDTWLLGDRWEQCAGDGPAPRSGHVMAGDEARRCTVLTGGSSFDGKSVTRFDDTWEWDGAKWVRRA